MIVLRVGGVGLVVRSAPPMAPPPASPDDRGAAPRRYPWSSPGWALPRNERNR